MNLWPVFSVLFYIGLWHSVPRLMHHYYYYIYIDLLSHVLCPFYVFYVKHLELVVSLLRSTLGWISCLNVAVQLKFLLLWGEKKTDSDLVQLSSPCSSLPSGASPFKFHRDETHMFIDDTWGQIILQNLDKGNLVLCDLLAAQTQACRF